MPAPAEVCSDLRRAVAGALPRLWSYLRTWQRPDGLFGGLIATWWSSTVETAEPHPMNQFPLLIGLVRLHGAGVRGSEWLAEAGRVADGLIGSIGRDGRLANDYGDIPGKSTGPVFYSSCVRSLCELYLARREERLLEAARRLDALLARSWTRGDELVGCPVTNQELSWAWARLWLGRARNDAALIEQAQRIARRALAHQVVGGAMAGGFHQGRFDDRLITVYVGKCIEPLLEIGRATSDEMLIAAARRAGEYMLRQDVAAGIWLNYHGPEGWWYRLLRQATRLDRRVFQQRIPLYRLRRPFIRWRTIGYPSWLARSADGIRALGALGRDGELPRAHAERYTRRLLALQYPHGGFPNAVGFFGDPARRNWQDAAPCTRWNAYVFLLLCQLAADLGVTEVEPAQVAAEWSCELEGPDARLHETRDRIELRDATGVCWRIAKPHGRNEVITPAWRGDLSGPRAAPRGHFA